MKYLALLTVLIACSIASPSASDAAAVIELSTLPATPSPARRTLFNITWNCLSTIFICAWLSVHPNVPPSGHWKALWRRLKTMFWTMIAPELILAWAVRQWYAAWDIRDTVNGTREGSLLSLTRGFETNLLQRTAHWSFSDYKVLAWDCKCVRCGLEI